MMNGRKPFEDLDVIVERKRECKSVGQWRAKWRVNSARWRKRNQKKRRLWARLYHRDYRRVILRNAKLTPLPAAAGVERNQKEQND